MIDLPPELPEHKPAQRARRQRKPANEPAASPPQPVTPRVDLSTLTLDELDAMLEKTGSRLQAEDLDFTPFQYSPEELALMQPGQQQKGARTPNHRRD